MPEVKKETRDQTNEELRAILDSAPTLDESATSEIPTEPAEEPAPATTPETPQGAKPEPETPGQPVAQPNADPVLARLESMEKAMNAKFDSLAEINKNLQKYNGHLSNQLGVLRQQQGQPTKPADTIQEPSDDEVLEKPTLSVKKLIAADKAAEARRKEEGEAAHLQQMKEVAAVVVSYVPADAFGPAIAEMAEVLRRDKVPEQFIEKFRQNPFATGMQADGLINLYHRTAQGKELATRNAEIADLKKRIADLEKGPATMAANLKEAANAAPNISSNNVRTVPKPKTGAPGMHKRSSEELRAILQNAPAPKEEDE